jgi:hypothetical protein
MRYNWAIYLITGIASFITTIAIPLLYNGLIYYLPTIILGIFTSYCFAKFLDTFSEGCCFGRYSEYD